MSCSVFEKSIKSGQGECNVRIWKYENEKLRKRENEEMQELQHQRICPNHDLRNGWDKIGA